MICPKCGKELFDDLESSAEKKRSDAQAAIAQKKAEEEAAALEAKKQTAIAANPTTVNVANKPTVTLTGTLTKSINTDMAWHGAFYILELSQPITFNGTTSSDNSKSKSLTRIQVHSHETYPANGESNDPSESSRDQYLDKTITVTGRQLQG